MVVFAQARGFRGGAQAAEEEDVDFGVGVAGEVAGEEEEGGEGFEEGGCWWVGGMSVWEEDWSLVRERDWKAVAFGWVEVVHQGGFAGGLEEGAVPD